MLWFIICLRGNLKSELRDNLEKHKGVLWLFQAWRCGLKSSLKNFKVKITHSLTGVRSWRCLFIKIDVWVWTIPNFSWHRDKNDYCIPDKIDWFINKILKNRDKRTEIITASPTGSLSRSCILILWYVYRDQFRTFHICKRTNRQQLFISATPTHLPPTQVPTQLYEMWEIYWRKMKLLHSSDIRFFNWMWWIIYTNISENYGERGEKVFVLDTGEETSRWRLRSRTALTQHRGEPTLF